eukprot:scpid75416/ scgid33579/ 
MSGGRNASQGGSGADHGVHAPWVMHRASGEVVRVYWWHRLNIDSALVQDLVRIVAARWDDLARMLTCSETSSERYFKHYDIDAFAEESRNTQRCRKMLSKWLQACDSHNVGALFNALHESGFGRVADEKLNGPLGDHVQHIMAVQISDAVGEGFVSSSASSAEAATTGITTVPVQEGSTRARCDINFSLAPAHRLDEVYEQLEGMLELDEQRRLANIILETVGYPSGETAARNEATSYRCSFFRAVMMLWTRKAENADGHAFLDAMRKVSVQKTRLCQRYLLLGS